jgi:hypothetical protein
VCISWTLKCLISLMHGVTMKITDDTTILKSILQWYQGRECTGLNYPRIILRLDIQLCYHIIILLKQSTHLSSVGCFWHNNYLREGVLGVFLTTLLRLYIVGHRTINMDHWWNDNNKRKQTDSEKNMSQCHFVHQKSHFPYGLSLHWTRATVIRGWRLASWDQIRMQ